MKDQLATRRSASRPAAPQVASAPSAAASNDLARDLVSDQQRDGAEGALRDWWDAAARWVGDRTAEVGGAVSGAWDSVQETVGRYWDAVGNTDLDWEGDEVRLSTDLDTLMPVLPQKLQDAIALGGVDPAANQATLSLNRATGSVTLDVPDLQLGAMALGGGISVQTLALSGLQVTVRDGVGLAREGLSDTAADPLIDWVMGDDQQRGGNGGSIRVASALATGVVGPQGVAVDSIQVQDLRLDLASEEGGLLPQDGAARQLASSFSVGEVVVRGASGGDAGAESLRLTELSGGLDVDHASGYLALAAAAGTGLRSGDARLGDARVGELHTTFHGDSLADPQGLQRSLRAGTLAAHGIELGHQQARAIEARGLTLDESGQDLRFGLEQGRVEGYRSNRTTVAEISMGGVQGRRDDRTTRATARSLSVAGLDTPGFDADALGVRRFALDLQNDYGYVGAYAGRLEGEGLETRHVSLDSARMTGVDTRTAIKRSGTISTGSVASATGRGLHVDDVDIAGSELADVEWRAGPHQLRVEAGRVGVSGMDGPVVDADRAQVQGFRYAERDGVRQGTVGRLSGQGIEAAGGATRASVEQARLQSLSARSDDTHDEAHLARGELVGVQIRHDGRREADASSSGSSSGSSGGSSGGSAARVDTGAARASIAPERNRNGKLDPVALAGLVDDADIRASVPLVPRDYGLVEVEPDTVATAQARIRNGKLDPAHSRIDTSKELDGPMWIGVGGAYMESGAEGGARVRSELSGMYDFDVTGAIPGVRGDLPTDLQALAALATGGGDRGTAPAKVDPAPAGGTAKAARTTPAPAPAGGKPDAVADLSRLQADATIGLNGQLAVPGVQATLARERDTDNRIGLHARGTEQLAVEFVRLLVSALKLDVGDTAASAGQLSIGDARVTVDAGGGGPQVQGDIGRVQVQELDVRRDERR